MAINIKRFVDVNILHHAKSNVMSTRDVVVLITSEGDATDKTFVSKTDYDNRKTASTPIADDYAKVYFDNGGNKLRVLTGISLGNVGDTIDALPNEQIVVAYAGAYADILPIAQTREANPNVYGINQKIILARTDDEEKDEEVANFAVKLSTVVGAEMTIAAYLSNINVYGLNTVHDYAFTKEVITAEAADDEVLGNCLTNNMNVVMNVANANRNLGGNLKDGKDLVNEFMLIVLQQTLTARLLNVLTQKIKGSTGLAAIHTAMAQELAKYVTNGYLTIDKVWGDTSLTIMYNNKNYEIIAANTPLLLGYHITILPLTSLSDEDKQQRKTPPIYVVIADSYGIRHITINGEVI